MRRAYLPHLILLFALSVIAALATSHGSAAPGEVVQTPHIAKLAGINQSDVFGFDVQIDNDLLFVGIPHADQNGADSGAVQIFSRNQGGPDNWGSVRLITDTLTALGDHFGISMAGDQDTLAVGTYFDNIFGYPDVGSAYIFYRDQGGTDNWGRVRHLVPDAPANSLFGISVDLEGELLVIGAREDGGGPGSAYIYERNQGGPDNWGLQKKINASDGLGGDQFGQSVAISNNLVIVGAPNHAGGNGAAYVFGRDQGGPDNWGQVKELVPDDLITPITFGRSVDIEGSIAAVGAKDTNDGGAFFIFEEDLGGPGSWNQRVRVESPVVDPGSDFGISLDLSGDLLLVGAQAGDGLDTDSGLAYLFDRNMGGPDYWGLVMPFEASDGFANDVYGFAVSLDGNQLVVGAYQDDDACPINPTCNSGSAYVYYLSATNIYLPLIVRDNGSISGHPSLKNSP